MPCYHPLPAWKRRTLSDSGSGSRGITFRMDDGYKDQPVSIPCGGCIGCRLARAQEWALRCVHEAQLHEHSSFVTLTYDEQKAPSDGGLRPRDMVLFLKRLRKRFGRFRYFQCGEYGENTERPHHHALLFGLRFRDLELLRVSNGNSLHVSGELADIWGNGHCTVGEVTYESAGYVARYSLKKLGAAEYAPRLPPYLTMSRRPGIGAGWYERYKSDVYPEGVAVELGRKMRPPRFYEERWKKENVRGGPHKGLGATPADALKCRRVAAASCDVDSSGSRLLVREAIRKHGVELLLERPI